MSTAFALAIFLCFLLQLASPLPLVKVGTMLVIWLKVLVLLAAPFAVAGVAVSLASNKKSVPGWHHVRRGPLRGRSFGCLIVPLLLNLVDAASAMFCVAALAGLAGVCFGAADGEVAFDDSFSKWRILRRPGLVAVALMVLAAANATTRRGLQPISAKFNQIQVGTNYEFEKWNSFSRVVVSSPGIYRPALWGASPTVPQDLVAEQRTLNIDGFAGTTMPRFSGSTDTVDFLKYDITNLAYAARPTGRIAIIGVGSGRDLLSAYTFGSRQTSPG